MSKAILTDGFAKKAEPGLYWDTHKRAPPGFLLRVTPAGARAWCLNYETIDGIERRMTIGRVATYSVAAARDRAAELRRIVDEGGDPLNAEQERRRRRASPILSSAMSLRCCRGADRRPKSTICRSSTATCCRRSGRRRSIRSRRPISRSSTATS